ncbi:MAG: hypothetical protein O2945_18415, partial [Planctomycetota bacterium]|nr:hypothetical protein [Planctomycetota bacterium]
MPNNDDVPALPPALADAIREYRELDEVPSEDRDSEWWTRYESVCARRNQLIDEVLVPKAEANHAELKPRLIALGKAAADLALELDKDRPARKLHGLTRKRLDPIHKECLALRAALTTPFNVAGKIPVDVGSRLMLTIREDDDGCLPVVRDLDRLLSAVVRTRSAKSPCGGDQIRVHAQAILDRMDVLPPPSIAEIVRGLIVAITVQKKAIETRSTLDSGEASRLWIDLLILLDASNDERIEKLHLLLQKAIDETESTFKRESRKSLTRKNRSECFPVEVLGEFEAQRDELLKSMSQGDDSAVFGAGDVSETARTGEDTEAILATSVKKRGRRTGTRKYDPELDLRIVAAWKKGQGVYKNKDELDSLFRLPNGKKLPSGYSRKAIDRQRHPPNADYS